MAGVKGRSGRKPERTGWREWCRSIVLDPEVQSNIAAEAKRNPELALKLAEHGFGRPSQALDLNVNPRDSTDEIYRAEFAEGPAVHPSAAEGLPN